ncbi:uncharacterized protein BDR25DRAFT_382231 [Lindgomyces ingoldianus]|uniref:Uncharacterized protein n=1 Tax=Lindgomyces ingoldianus TaxID=673940 RepID=A0ACB6R816_9PLEO|nr:uncharacterized protein BDR25DRAFT_382231 [Lindgomyces ingoldianus]KAF2475301.1 hypothetical protein BDR25DRAFT_382231 [Lindgomyces ingoldianus]
MACYRYPTRTLFLLTFLLSNSFLGYAETLTSRATSSTTSVSLSSSSGLSSGGGNQSILDSDLANFGQTVNVLGSMERTDQDFVDGLALDLFSPSSRTLFVQQNTSPLPGNFVSGSTGEQFIALSNYSYVIKLNETANDLIAKVELPYDPVMLQQMGIDQGNTYVGTLASDKKSWVVSESQRNVHVSENKTRIIKMTSLDGEHILLGRMTEDVSNIFVQYGQGATRTVNVTGGQGVQEAEFIDGLRFTVESEQPFKMNVDIKNGVSKEDLPRDAASFGTQRQILTTLDSFAWVINTTIPTQKITKGEVKFPFNPAMLAAKTGNATNAQQWLTVAKRSLNATSEKFTPLAPASQVRFTSGDRIVVPGFTQLDGQYVVLVHK